MLIHFLLFNSIFLLILGIATYLKSQTRLSLWFFLINLGVSFWNLTAYAITLHPNFVLKKINLLSQIQHISALFFTFAIFIFTTLFLKSKKTFLNYLFLIICIVFSIFIFSNKITVLSIVHNQLIYSDTLGYIFYAIFICILFISIIINLFEMSKTSAKLKSQAIVLFTGVSGLFILGAIFNLLLPILNFNNLLALGYSGSTFLSLSFAYTITKQELLDIKVIIGRTLAITLTSILYCTLYLFLKGIYLHYIDLKLTISFTIFSCSFLILTGLTFDKLKTAMITTSQKLFVKGKYNYRQTLLKITSELQTIASVSDFVTVIQKDFLDDIEVSTTHIFLPQEFENRKDISSHLIAHSKNTTSELPGFDIIHTPIFTLHSPENPVLFTKELDPQIAQPLLKQNIFATIATYTPDNQLLSIILLGKKLSEEAFNADDYDLFTSLAAQIPGHLLRIHKTRVAAEMDVAQRIQTDILPKKPTLPQLELACFIAPAEEVGGDYYDVYHNNDTSWIILGDVAGHGVASGLVMFMVQSIVTTLLQSHDSLTPGDLNYLANIILCKNFERTSESRPMTLVTLSTKDSRTFLMNGSHDGIYIYRAATKTVETHRIDHFPFGIGFVPDLEKELFINESFSLETNDVLFLCTDGITEAFKNGNPKAEQYGEERLTAFLSEHAHLEAEVVQEKFLEDINTFTQKAYVDDITFLVIKAV